MLQVESNSDPSFLNQCLVYTSSHTDPPWRIAHAYVLWRLSQLDDLQAFLLNLPSLFHNLSQYWLLLGLSYKDQFNSSSLSEHAYLRGLELDPTQPDLCFNLANVLRDRDPFRSLSLYILSLNVNPHQSHCWHNYGQLLHEHGFFEQSLYAFKISHLLDPQNISTLCDLGLAYMNLGFYTSSEFAFLRSIALDPLFVRNYINFASFLVSAQRPHEALQYFDVALRLEPDSSHALFNLGLCHLSLGNYILGWKLYNQRLYTSIVPVSSSPSKGALITSLPQMCTHDDTPIIIWAEQGLGDTIQFSRYLVLLSQLHISFEFHCQKELISLFRDWFLFPLNVQPLECQPRFHRSNLHSPLMSLPFIFATELYSIPSSFPLFKPPSIPPRLFLHQPPGGLSVGLVWSSNPNNPIMYRKKSIPLHILMPLMLDLLNLDLIDLHSIQVGSDTTQLTSWIKHPRITDWSPKLADLSDTAHLLSQFDLVISVDTAVAHLSASLETPTWLLLPFDSDFRWLRQRDDSPWYPNVMRLFRQKTRNDWSEVVSNLRFAFDELFLVDLKSLSASKDYQ